MKTNQLQYTLLHLGYYTGKIDSVNGPKTKEAIKKFQASHNLVVDGICGPKTTGTLKSVVEDIQTKLRAKGYNIALDGLFGTNTTNAIREFQIANGLNADGVCGNKTYTELNKEVKTITWADLPNFTEEELLCRCGHCNQEVKPDIRLGIVLQKIRNHFGKPVNNSCAVRCKWHNDYVKGAYNSWHLTGHAADIHIDGVSAKQIVDYAKTVDDVHYTYAINNNYAHVDINR